MEERIVSAANRSPEGLVVMCVRHGCDLFFTVVDKIFTEDHSYLNWEQGFVTNKFRFVSRKEAWIIERSKFIKEFKKRKDFKLLDTLKK